MKEKIIFDIVAKWIHKFQEFIWCVAKLTKNFDEGKCTYELIVYLRWEKISLSRGLKVLVITAFYYLTE